MAIPIEKDGVMARHYWQLDRHGSVKLSDDDILPWSGVKFGGQEVPFFNQAIDMVVRAHRTLYPAHFRLGWDVAICDQGPMIIEVNCRDGASKWIGVFDPHEREEWATKATRHFRMLLSQSWTRNGSGHCY